MQADLLSRILFMVCNIQISLLKFTQFYLKGKNKITYTRMIDALKNLEIYHLPDSSRTKYNNILY